MHVILDSTLERLEDRQKLKPLKGHIEEYNKLAPVVWTSVNGTVGHDNYLGYLAEAWNNHLGYVIRPDYLWNMVISELAIVVRDKPEHYRDLFTTADEKVEITVVGSTAHHLIYAVSEKLQNLVPTNMSAFLPDFTTTSDSAMFAHRATFLDTVSPYYNYSMLLCGFPSVELRGTSEDWLLFRKKVMELSEIFMEKSDTVLSYLTGVGAIVSTIQDYVDDLAAGKEIDTAFLKNIMSLKRCGSGHQVEVDGWISEMYINKPRPAYVENFSRHISVVDYKDLSANKDYRIYSGLLCSEINGDILWPDFGIVQVEREED